MYWVAPSASWLAAETSLTSKSSLRPIPPTSSSTAARRPTRSRSSTSRKRGRHSRPAFYGPSLTRPRIIWRGRRTNLSSVRHSQYATINMLILQTSVSLFPKSVYSVFQYLTLLGNKLTEVWKISK